MQKPILVTLPTPAQTRRPTERQPRFPVSVLVLVHLFFSGVSPGQSQPEPAKIPSVSLEAMEPAVRAQLEEQRTALERISQGIALGTTGNTPSNLEQRRLAAAYGELGQLYLLYDLTVPAKVALSNASLFQPQEPRWAYLLGTLFELDAEYQAATESFRQALKLALEVGAAPTLLHPIRSRLARSHLQSNQLDDAQTLFDQLANTPSFQAFGRYGLGRIAASKGNHELAVRHLAAALAAQPRANQIHYQLALSYRELGQLDQAKFHLANRGDGTVSFPDPIVMELQSQVGGAGAMLTLGRISLATGALDVAEQRFRRAIEIDPNSAAAHQALGNLARQRGDRSAAIPSFEQAIRLSPDDARLRFLVAQLLVDSAGTQPDTDSKALLERAEQHLDEALLLAPDFLAARVLLATTLSSLGQHQRADALYATGLERTPETFDLHYLRAQALAARITTLAGNPGAQVAAWGELGRSSIQEFLQGLQQSGKPLARAAEIDLGLLQLRLGDSVPGRRRLQALLDAKDIPTNIAARAAFYLGNEAAQRAPDPIPETSAQGSKGALDHPLAKAAQSFYQQALALDPDLGEAHFSLGTLLARFGRYGTAAEQYQKLILLDPSNQTVRFSQAMALVLGDRHAEARAALEEALEVLPGASVLAHLLTRLLVASPHDSVRDATVGLDLASRLFEAFPSAEHGETVAMAFAEAGRFDKAVEWQQRVIDQLTTQSTFSAIAQRRLEQYQQKQPVRSPWLE